MNGKYTSLTLVMKKPDMDASLAINRVTFNVGFQASLVL